VPLPRDRVRERAEMIATMADVKQHSSGAYA
jgi:hypothetical protein